jgi:hypothetical protein
MQPLRATTSLTPVSPWPLDALAELEGISVSRAIPDQVRDRLIRRGPSHHACIARAPASSTYRRSCNSRQLGRERSRCRQQSFTAVLRKRRQRAGLRRAVLEKPAGSEASASCQRREAQVNWRARPAPGLPRPACDEHRATCLPATACDSLWRGQWLVASSPGPPLYLLNLIRPTDRWGCASMQRSPDLLRAARPGLAGTSGCGAADLSTTTVC